MGQTYVATQGDPYDAQKDIALAVAGAGITMLLAFLINQKRKQHNTGAVMKVNNE